MSCPGRSQISHTSSSFLLTSEVSEATVLVDAVLSRCLSTPSWPFLEDFLCRDIFSFSRSSSCSSSSCINSVYNSLSEANQHTSLYIYSTPLASHFEIFRPLLTLDSTSASSSLISLLSYPNNLSKCRHITNGTHIMHNPRVLHFSLTQSLAHLIELVLDADQVNVYSRESFRAPTSKRMRCSLD